jgi:hypothetical protein
MTAKWMVAIDRMDNAILEPNAPLHQPDSRQTAAPEPKRTMGTARFCQPRSECKKILIGAQRIDGNKACRRDIPNRTATAV